jgi:WD40 repeat protein
MRSSPPPGPVTVLRGHEDSVNSLAFLSNSLLYSGGVDGVLKLWNLQTRRSILSFNGHGDSSILSLCPQYQIGTLVSCGRDGFVRAWKFDNEGVSRGNNEAFTSICTGSRHFCNASCDRLSTSTHPHLVATPTSEETEIALWDLRDTRARIATILDTKDGRSSGNEHGMVCCLLLQSRSIAPIKRRPPDDSSAVLGEGEGEGEAESSSSAAAVADQNDDDDLVSRTPQLFAGYEDGSVCCFDIRTFR